MKRIKPLTRPMTLILMGGLIVAGIIGCSTTAEKHLSPDFGQASAEAFAVQVVNPAAPADPRAAATLPGDISDQIYQKRYIKRMTEEKEDDDSGRMQNINTFR